MTAMVQLLSGAEILLEYGCGGGEHSSGDEDEEKYEVITVTIGMLHCKSLIKGDAGEDDDEEDVENYIDDGSNEY